MRLRRARYIRGLIFKREMEKRDIIIAGSGPAGISVALSLKQSAAALGAEVLILEKEQHPRHKLCGGGVTEFAEQILDDLQVERRVAGFPIHRVRFHIGRKPLEFARENLMRIVLRSEFDADLVRQARVRGVEIRENEAVLELGRQDGRVQVKTSRDVYLARVVIGADGARSLVRRKMIRENATRVSRLLEVAVKVNAEETPEFRENMAVLDFRPLKQHLQGYLWDFPSFINNEAHLNIGVFDSRIRENRRADLRRLLTHKLEARGMSSTEVGLMGHPERWFVPNGIYSSPNVLLVGDAAGIEPWLGEGISMALGYGPVAADAIKRAFETNDFSFENYNQLIADNRLGKLLNRNRLIARYFYWRKLRPLVDGLASVLLAHFTEKKGIAARLIE